MDLLDYFKQHKLKVYGTLNGVLIMLDFNKGDL